MLGPGRWPRPAHVPLASKLTIHSCLHPFLIPNTGLILPRVTTTRYQQYSDFAVGTGWRVHQPLSYSRKQKSGYSPQAGSEVSLDESMAGRWSAEPCSGSKFV